MIKTSRMGFASKLAALGAAALLAVGLATAAAPAKAYAAEAQLDLSLAVTDSTLNVSFDLPAEGCDAVSVSKNFYLSVTTDALADDLLADVQAGSYFKSSPAGLTATVGSATAPSANYPIYSINILRDASGEIVAGKSAIHLNPKKAETLANGSKVTFSIPLKENYSGQVYVKLLGTDDNYSVQRYSTSTYSAKSAIGDLALVSAEKSITVGSTTPTVSLSTEATSVKVGDTFTVALTADQALAALQGELAYDGSVLELVKVEAGSGLAFAEGVGGFTATDALFSFWGNTSEDAGAVAVATFKAIKPAAATSVSLEGLVSGASGESDEVEVAAGEALSLAVGLSGTLGDVNNSGKVNIVDAQVAYDLGAGKYAADEAAMAKLLACWAEGATVDMVKAFADVNADSAVDATDAFAIQYAVHHNGAFGPATD